MGHLNDIFKKNFVEYASYVIKDRAIPDIVDGLKPVQRRILHSLFEMDDGKFNKVANVVGHCMKYHPHGDASIYSALVVLANKEMFIDKQGNFGNIFTGDPASAARYIECRLKGLAREALYNPELTEYTKSYDGRNDEPVVFPSKIPTVLIQGAEGIAVGMSTKILPHNFIEVLGAVKAALNGESVSLHPDFPNGGIVDVSDYDDGRGKVLSRALIEIPDNKRVMIKELPFGVTSEALMTSIEDATKKNKLKVAAINDYSSDTTEIEIKLPRGVHAEDTIEALYAFTSCEVSISTNPLLIQDNKPVLIGISELIPYYAKTLKSVLKRELELEKSKIERSLRSKILDKIFIENKIYKSIEKEKTADGIHRAIVSGFEPFDIKAIEPVTEDDTDRLLRIPLRRISAFDIAKSNKEIKDAASKLRAVKKRLGEIKKCAEEYLDKLIDKYKELYPRRTKVESFTKVDVKRAAKKDLELSYNPKEGYLGYSVDGVGNIKVSEYDRVILIDKSGVYRVSPVVEKDFVGSGLKFFGTVDKNNESKTIYTAVYKNKEGQAYIKRFRIDKYIINKEYTFIPEGCKLVKLIAKDNAEVTVKYKPKPRIKTLEETFAIDSFLVKGVKAKGVRLSVKEIASVSVASPKET